MGECAICGRELPKDLLVAAHVKKRVACSESERRDYAKVAALMCHLGCDQLFERGFIAIGDGGTVLCSDALSEIATDALGPLVRLYHDRKVEWWDAERELYCRWHRDNVFRRRPSASRPID